MCCSLSWIVYSRHLAVLVCKLMGVQSIWLLPPCSLFGANPPLICMDPSLGRERSALKKRKKKSPRQSLLIILFTVIILKRGTQKYKQKVLVLFIFLQPTQETVFRPSFAKSKLGNEWHLKTRNGLLTPDFVWRSPCSSLWFRDGFIIPLLTFFFSSSSPLKLNDKLWNFVVWLFLMWVLKNDNMPSACDRAFPPPTPSSLPVSCCGSSSHLTAPSFQNISVSVLRPSLSFLAAVCFTAWSVFVE